FYCDDCGETVVTGGENPVCPKCGGHMTQDPDTLDTWFSSALWPFSTMGWPDKTEDLDYFYPTNTLVTGYDIITFWVSRMIFSALEYTDNIPFDTVLIHGLVRDAQGRKMSKSLGNGIDPLEIIDKYGADALRFALATGNSPGNDMRFSDEKIEAARNFANKIWNASRFVRMNLTIEKNELPNISELALEDKWILHKFNGLAASVNAALERYEIGVALSNIYDFAWDIFCDWYIELAKTRLSDKESDKNIIAQKVITYVLVGTLKLLHPFMPFITEEIYQSLPHDAESIMIDTFPVECESLRFAADAEKMERIIDAISAIRARRADMNVVPSRKAKVYIETKYADSFNDDTAIFFKKLASASEVEIKESFDASVISADDAVQIITDSAMILLPLSDIIDTEKERARLTGELAKLEESAARISAKLANEGFVAKAPAAVVEGERAKLAKLVENIDGVKTALSKLK
ncbi:MAG: valine--tRNA ligase, partial [Ruminococcaceae bacterium]|nr:valine--tRNA ligase [Oscillospiraceae bacterium]